MGWRHDSKPMGSSAVGDNDTSYYIFQTYYLPMQPNERNLAYYRRYRLAKGLSKTTPAGTPINAPGAWKNWSEGRTFEGSEASRTVFENSVAWPACEGLMTPTCKSRREGRRGAVEAAPVADPATGVGRR